MRLTESHLYREIHEQPAIIKQLIENGKDSIRVLAEQMHTEGIKNVYIAARGTSDNVGRYAQYLLGLNNQIVVTLGTPSLFSIYKKSPYLGDKLVLGISQSGQSPDLVEVLSEANRQGAMTATITNDTNSPMAQKSRFVIPLLTGEEKSLAATKTYTAQLTVISMLSVILSSQDLNITELYQLPAAIDTILAQSKEIGQLVKQFKKMQHCVVIGRGLNYATAFEFSLKLKELTYTFSEPYSSADFLHGPIALINDGFTVFVIAPDGIVIPELLDFINQVTQRGGKVVSISNVPDILNASNYSLPFPVSLPEWLSPIAAIIPAQIFAMDLASMGYDVDHPRGLVKVTKTM